MLMKINKRIVSTIIVSLFCPVSLILAVSIPNPLSGVNSFGDLLMKIAAGAGALIASLSVVMIIVAGILYLTSAGSPERIGTAKKALIYAVVGIVIGASASAIVAVIKNVIGA